MNLNQFVNTGADSATVNDMKKSIAREADLQKAMNRAGLVQKEVQVQGKNGTTFTRKQWVKASDVSNNSKASRLSSYEGKTNSEMRVIFDGKTAADVQDEKARIFESLGRPGNGNPKRKEFERATVPLNRLISDTINNGTGDASRDYATLLETSVVKASDTDKKSVKDTVNSDTEKISPRCKRNLDRALQNRDSFVDIRNEYKKAVDKLVKESKATGTSDFRKRNIQQEIKSLNNELSYITKKFEERESEDSKPNLDSKKYAKETKLNPFNSIKPKDKDDGGISDKSSLEYDSLFKEDASQDSKRQTLKSLLGSGHSREDIMSQAKKMGVNWKHSDHPGINWMRASMAITGITTKGNKGEM